MREVIIPCVYNLNTGEYLRVCRLKYDSNNKIIEVDHWDGDGVITFKEGEFDIEDCDKELNPLYQE